MRTFTNKKAVPVKQTAKQKLQYVRKNWQLYLFFLMPALLLTIIFKYIPMSGVLIAFEDYNVIDGVFGSEWVGLEYFQRFFVITRFYELSDEHVEAECIWITMGLSGTDYSCITFKPH